MDLLSCILVGSVIALLVLCVLLMILERYAKCRAAPCRRTCSTPRWKSCASRRATSAVRASIITCISWLGEVHVNRKKGHVGKRLRSGRFASRQPEAQDTRKRLLSQPSPSPHTSEKPPLCSSVSPLPNPVLRPISLNAEWFDPAARAALRRARRRP